jgi:hypothetical protein
MVQCQCQRGFLARLIRNMCPVYGIHDSFKSLFFEQCSIFVLNALHEPGSDNFACIQHDLDLSATTIDVPFEEIYYKQIYVGIRMNHPHPLYIKNILNVGSKDYAI